MKIPPQMEVGVLPKEVHTGGARAGGIFYIRISSANRGGESSLEV